jgi:DNA-binding transcriptional ArsR family regulator
MKTELKKLAGYLESKESRDYMKMLRVIGGSMRLRVLMLLRKAGRPLSVTEIAEVMDGTLSRISHQVGILKRYGFVHSKRSSRSVLYSLASSKVYDYVQLGKKK